ncbi:MAG: N-acetyl-D-Glu racemase DgcA [Pikeienuella sp.]
MRGIVRREVFPIAGVFTISRGSRTEAEVISVELIDGPHRGIGECVPYARYGETQEGVLAEIEDWLASGGGSREALNAEMKAGAARNALDCAFWDLEAGRAGKRVWELAGLAAPKPEITAYTLSLASPEKMRAKARENAHRPLLKIKLGGGEEDLDRLRSVRQGAPEARIIVDANEGWTLGLYREIAPLLLELGVAMVEQPLPAGDDAPLMGAERPLPVCADEAAHDRGSLPGLIGKYDMVNIKLDKTGGLTEALALREAALAAGLKVMVGCMIGSSLAMAPAVLAAQGAAFTDLDGPLLLARDRRPGLLFDERGVHPPAPELWG